MEKKEYLLQTCMVSTWENEEKIEEVYTKIVSDYLLKCHCENDVITVEDHPIKV